MNAPPIEEEELHAFVDGQLSRGRCTAVLAYLGQNPQETTRLAAYATQKDELRRRLDAVGLPAEDPTTAELQHALAGQLSRRSYREWLHRVAATAALLCVGWLSNTFYQHYLAERLPDVVLEAAQAHEIFSGDLSRPVELTAAAESDMAAWFSTRLGDPVEIPSLQAVGLRLVGGRLLAGDDGPVAQLIDEDRNGYRLTLGLSAEPTDSGPAIEVVTLEGLTAGYWHEGAFTYALVGRTSEQQLVAIATWLGADEPKGWL
jgi:anti-sigma factor RsiW